MVKAYLLSMTLMRVVLPAGLLLSIALRPFGLSVIYLLLYLLAPLNSVPNTNSRSGFTFVLINLIISLLLLVLHTIWHVVLAGFAPYGTLLIDNPIIQLIGLNLGLVSYSNIDTLMAIHYLAPELTMAGVSIFVYVSLKKLLVIPEDGSHERNTKFQKYPLLTSTGKYLCLFLIMFSGVLRPSITSGIYYLVFIGAATAWSIGMSLERGFAVIGRCLMAIMAAHVSLVIVYQCSWFMELLPPDADMARYFGITKLVNISMENPSGFVYEVSAPHMWATLSSPLVILLTYFVLAIETRELFKPKLLRNSSSSKHWPNSRSQSGGKPLIQDSTGSVVVLDDEISLDELEEKPTLMDDIIAAVIDFFRVLVRYSYIATTITMMAWSIMYHSWLTFVLLMWANVVWLCQDQRSFMLKTSPVLVGYAILLLLKQYIYSMNLTEEELPTVIEDVNLKQIGIGRPPGEPCVPLLLKSLFACMFWVTLRQRVQEFSQQRKAAKAADLAPQLQMTASSAPASETLPEDEKRSRLLLALGKILRRLCARYWIYVVVIMLFVIGITGERMTIFRILYMALFLLFILLFQISWKLWRRMIYGFWITVIIYSMINLILIYVYQFDNFSNIIEKYLLINKKLQNDLGLEPYHPADLFVKLLTPTLFLIMTIMQVHYFHKDFMELSGPKTSANTDASEGASHISQAGASTMKDDLPPLPLEGSTTPVAGSITDVDISSKRSAYRKSPVSRSYTTMTHKTEFLTVLKKGFLVAREKILICTDYMFNFLDIHLVKIVFLALMLLCVLNVCAMHVPIMCIISLAPWFGARKQRLCLLFISSLISLYFMLKMVYQIEYILHSFFEVNCTRTYPNNTEYVTVYNNAEWIGFNKVSRSKPLVKLLKGYIALIALFTFYCLVTYRQKALRDGQSKINLMFPEITRKDADKDIIHCVKYLLNYGFYKFGVEITLICLVGAIGSRMDVYAVIYAAWLIALVSMSRERQARVWSAFAISVTILVPLQYMIAVGFMPQLCLPYPWEGDSEHMKHLRAWLFLPYNDDPPHAVKLIFDFLLLLFATRQIRVFRTEKTHGDDYQGGSNSEDIGKDWETPNFVNPVPDFLGFVGTWLDVVKRVVFLGMLWVTLAIMFMTGTNRVNLFSMGYLVGSFVFLWQGTDFYLRPKEAILRWWSWLLLYNVTIVVVKALLQIPGCLFGELVQDNACWLVQLLGIGCVDKFVGGNIARFIKMQYNQQQDSTCSVPQENIGLAWDGVCFAFLLLQRRLFHSYYFYRIIDESKATTILASRGAELIEELRLKQMKVQENQEVKILEKIKVKMERIKANQEKIHGALTKEPGHHDRARDMPPYKPPASHQKAVRSGDYYMFDEFDEVDVHSKDEDSSSDEEGPKGMGIGKERRRYSQTETKPDRDRGNDETDKEKLPERQDDESATGLMDETVPPEQETWIDKLRLFGHTAWAFIASLLVTLSRYLMKTSRDYRYVSRTLSVEKNSLKEMEGFGIGIREGSQMIWEPLPDAVVPPKDLSTLEDQDDSMLKKGTSILAHVGYALWYAVLAHTDIVCYIMVFINQIQSATILSIPLPMMVFLWGTLTIPRPTKTFWVTLIAYTEVIVLIKSMFQFEILPWNRKAIPDNMPFTAPRIIGIERNFNYAIYDLLLLLIIFFHRFMLKSLGLWKETSPDIELREDTKYPLTAEDTRLIVDGRAAEVGQKYVELHDRAGPNNSKDSNMAEEIQKEKDREADADQEAGPSKPSGDDHYQVNDDHEPIIAVTTTLEDTYHHYPHVIMLSVKRYMRPMHRFFTRMLARGARVTADVYAYMFLCDFLNFLVVIFGFAAFGTHQGDGGVQAYIEENKVPIPFLVMLILQFALIVIDRALYLRKFMLGKILFQYALIIGVHIWMFFVLPFITERTFNSLLPPPMWYMVKCVYLLLSAYQIRCGYPRRIIGNFLCKSYRFLNMVFFRAFMAVPFVFELRTLMDWIWTDTSMTLMDWLKMEDIFASVFLLKCSRYVEDEFPQPRGVKKSSSSKYLLGGSVLAFVVAIIWFPLVFFAFGNSVGESNPPKDVTVKIRIGPYQPVYQMSAQSHNIHPFTEIDFNQLSNLYARDRTAQTFLSNYMSNDVAVIVINPNSSMNWDISPPELERLEEEVKSNASLAVKFTFVITHLSNALPNPPTIEDSREVQLEDAARPKLIAMLAGNATSDSWLHVKLLFPKFLKVFNKGTAKPAYQLMPQDPGPDENARLYRDVLLRLERSPDAMYWRVKEECSTKSDPLDSIPMNNCDKLIMYTFNDKLFPETLNFISGSGIIGLYTTFVFLASRVLRGFFSGIYTKIMFDDLPNVDRVLQLCLDIYLVREVSELALEEDLFAKLVFLYRSPETMIKWSRPKENNEEQRALPPSR